MRRIGRRPFGLGSADMARLSSYPRAGHHPRSTPPKPRMQPFRPIPERGPCCTARRSWLLPPSKDLPSGIAPWRPGCIAVDKPEVLAARRAPEERNRRGLASPRARSKTGLPDRPGRTPTEDPHTASAERPRPRRPRGAPASGVASDFGPRQAGFDPHVAVSGCRQLEQHRRAAGGGCRCIPLCGRRS